MGDQKTREERSPQVDKTLSYERDCRDGYGENNKSKRKAILKFKAASNRQGRHFAKVVVDRMTGDENADEEPGLRCRSQVTETLENQVSGHAIGRNVGSAQQAPLDKAERHLHGGQSLWPRRHRLRLPAARPGPAIRRKVEADCSTRWRA